MSVSKGLKSYAHALTLLGKDSQKTRYVCTLGIELFNKELEWSSVRQSGVQNKQGKLLHKWGSLLVHKSTGRLKDWSSMNDNCSQTVTQNVPRQLLKWRGISRIFPPCAIVPHSFCHHILHIHLKDHLWKVQQQTLHSRWGATTDIKLSPSQECCWILWRHATCCLHLQSWLSPLIS